MFKSSTIALALLFALLLCAAPAWAQDGAAVTQDRPAAAQDRPVAAQMGDAWITTKVQAQYFLDPDVKGRTIDVTTKDGVVTLTGTVDSEHERTQAVSIARKTDGVKNVVDKLALRAAAPAGTTGTRPERGPAEEKRPLPGSDELKKVAENDAVILTQIKTKMAVDPDVSALAIDVDVKDGVVTLTGKVKDEAARARALSIAREVQGVKSVRDKLTIQSP